MPVEVWANVLGHLDARDLARVACVSRALAGSTQSPMLPLRRRQLLARLESVPGPTATAADCSPPKRVEAAWRGHLLEVGAVQGFGDALWAVAEVASRWPWSAEGGPHTYGDGLARPLAAALQASDADFARLYPAAIDLLAETMGGSTLRLEAVLGPVPWPTEADLGGEASRALLREAMRDAVADDLTGLTLALQLHADVGAEAVLAYARERDAGDRALEQLAMGLCLVWLQVTAELRADSPEVDDAGGEQATEADGAALAALRQSPFVAALLARAPGPADAAAHARCVARTLAELAGSFGLAYVAEALGRTARPLRPVQVRLLAFFAEKIAAGQDRSPGSDAPE